MACPPARSRARCPHQASKLTSLESVHRICASLDEQVAAPIRRAESSTAARRSGTPTLLRPGLVRPFPVVACVLQQRRCIRSLAATSSATWLISRQRPAHAVAGVSRPTAAIAGRPAVPVGNDLRIITRARRRPSKRSPQGDRLRHGYCPPAMTSNMTRAAGRFVRDHDLCSVSESRTAPASCAFWTRPETGCYATSVAGGSFISAYMRGAGMAYRLTTTEWDMDSPAPGPRHDSYSAHGAGRPQSPRRRRREAGGSRRGFPSQRH
jgi:hypothetical protein